MASNAASLEAVDLIALKTKMYDACLAAAEGDSRRIFHQGDIEDMNLTPTGLSRDANVKIIMDVAQLLMNERLFKSMNTANGMAWQLRGVDEARKYRALTVEQEVVYSIIDEAGDDGAWSKTIKARSNLHDAVFRAAIKHLESKNLISDMKSVEHPTRKMYIKSSLSPSERATGGPWYTDGELDEPFVEHVIEILYHRIRERTFYQSSSYSARKPKKIVKKMTPEEAKAARAKGLGPRAGKEEVEDERAVKRRRYESMLPMPAGYQGYPTLNELTLYVENGQYVSQTLTSNDIQQLLDILIFDDRIEKVFAGADGVSYKALRKSLKDPDESATVLSEAPCGRCPVFDLCEEGGPVAPSNCEYFNDWLAI